MKVRTLAQLSLLVAVAMFVFVLTQGTDDEVVAVEGEFVALVARDGAVQVLQVDPVGATLLPFALAPATRSPVVDTAFYERTITQRLADGTVRALELGDERLTEHVLWFPTRGTQNEISLDLGFVEANATFVLRNRQIRSNTRGLGLQARVLTRPEESISPRSIAGVGKLVFWTTSTNAVLATNPAVDDVLRQILPPSEAAISQLSGADGRLLVTFEGDTIVEYDGPSGLFTTLRQPGTDSQLVVPPANTSLWFAERDGQGSIQVTNGYDQYVLPSSEPPRSVFGRGAAVAVLTQTGEVRVFGLGDIADGSIVTGAETAGITSVGLLWSPVE